MCWSVQRHVLGLSRHVDVNLNMLDVLWVEEGETFELSLVEVHEEELVGLTELGRLRGELGVKV